MRTHTRLALAFACATLTSGCHTKRNRETAPPDGRVLASASSDAPFTVLTPRGEPEAASPATAEVAGTLQDTGDVYWSPSGALVATIETHECGPPSAVECTPSRGLTVVGLTPKRTTVERPHVGALFGFRKADGGEWVVMVDSTNGALVEWNPRTEAARPSAYAKATAEAKGLCLAPDGDHFAVVPQSGPLEVRTLSGGSATKLDLPGNDAPVTCAFSPDSKKVAVSGSASTAVFAIGKPKPTATVKPALSHLRWSKSGSHVLGTSESDDVAIQLTTAYRVRASGGAIASAESDAADHDPRGQGFLLRDRCRFLHAGARRGAPTKPVADEPDGCFHTRAQAIAVGPHGKWVAVVEGNWGSRELSVLPVP